ncbi:MAG: ABC transporter ATP-binding protein [Chloroflexi bacterium]|nr:ABC transporter ATP-binding protein [Chloroflexota bacterium]
MLEVENLSWSVQLDRSAVRIVNEIELRVEHKEFVALIGPNGSGKSSLLRLIYRLLLPETGVVSLNGRNIWDMNAKYYARNAAVVSQEQSSDFDFNVVEVVMMGRLPHKGNFERDSLEDKNIAEQALARVGLTAFQNRIYRTLSGGEKQRVQIARALAQQPQLLILDEPTNHLDIRYQLEILELLRSLGISVLTALHDLNLAARYSNRIYLLKEGHIITHGPPKYVLTAKNIENVYGVAANVSLDQATGALHISYTGIANNRLDNEK